MKAIQQSGGTLFNGLTTRRNDWDGVNVTRRPISLGQSIDFRNSLTLINRKRLSSGESCAAHGNINSVNSRISFSPLVINCKKSIFPLANNQLSSECGVRSSGTEEPSYVEEGDSSTSSIEEVRGGVSVSTGPSLRRFQNAKREFIMLSLPAIAGQAIDPLAQLMETAYIGGLGSLELGSAGVSMSIFNVISKLFNIPLLSVATSFVAEDISRSANVDSTSEACYQEGTSNKSLIGMAERRQLSSVSTALLLAVGIGIFEALALYCGSGFLLNLMGIPEASPMRTLAERFLSLRALGAPAVVVSLALQGVFRGFKDTKTPVLCLGSGNLLAVFLFPILMYYFQLGVSGAAMSTVVSQYVVTILMIWHLNKRAILLPPRLGDLKFGSYIKSGGFLLGRTLAVLTTMTLATSMAARQGPVAMAGHQICLQVWLAVSLLTDALAASGQALIATSLSKCDFKSAREITYFVLKIGLLTGAFLAVILGVFFGSLATLFTKDAAVLGVVKSGILFVSASQPINALAFIFDGLHYGASDFRYAAFSMMVVGAISSGFLLYAPSNFGLPGVWFGLTLFMGLRMVAGFVRLLSKSGPWWFLHKNL